MTWTFLAILSVRLCMCSAGYTPWDSARCVEASVYGDVHNLDYSKIVYRHLPSGGPVCFSYEDGHGTRYYGGPISPEECHLLPNINRVCCGHMDMCNLHHGEYCLSGSSVSGTWPGVELVPGSACWAYTSNGVRYYGGGITLARCHDMPHDDRVCCNHHLCNQKRGRCASGHWHGTELVMELTEDTVCWAYTHSGVRYEGGGYSMEGCLDLPDNDRICCETDMCNKAAPERLFDTSHAMIENTGRVSKRLPVVAIAAFLSLLVMGGGAFMVRRFWSRGPVAEDASTELVPIDGELE